MGLFEKIFGTYSQRELKNIRPIVDRVLSLEDKYKAMSDRQLQEQTPALKARLAAGETLDDILPDAFAVCREAADRVLGMRPFPVQVLGGVVLGGLQCRFGVAAFWAVYFVFLGVCSTTSLWLPVLTDRFSPTGLATLRAGAGLALLLLAALAVRWLLRGAVKA